MRFVLLVRLLDGTSRPAVSSTKIVLPQSGQIIDDISIVLVWHRYRSSRSFLASAVLDDSCPLTRQVMIWHLAEVTQRGHR